MIDLKNKCFWTIWQNQYLLSLRERQQKFNKHPRIQSVNEAKVGDIVQIKESTPRGSWKIGRIVEMIQSQDGEERAARILTPNKNVLQRSIVHLYPLECQDHDEMQVENENIGNTQAAPDENQQRITEPEEDDTKRKRPPRKAATEARDRIAGQFIQDD